MASYAWVLEVRPGYEELYKLRHDAIWPEMLAELRAAGLRNYNIFRYGLTLFGYFETDDLEETKSRLSHKSRMTRAQTISDSMGQTTIL